MSLRPLMKFVVKHSCQYNKSSTQKMYGKWKEEKEEGKRKEEGRSRERGRKKEERVGRNEGINYVCL